MTEIRAYRLIYSIEETRDTDAMIDVLRVYRPENQCAARDVLGRFIVFGG